MTDKKISDLLNRAGTALRSAALAAGRGSADATYYGDLADELGHVCDDDPNTDDCAEGKDKATDAGAKKTRKKAKEGDG
jgi:hypothetical protein